MTNVRYDDDRKFLQNILDNLIAQKTELETRLDILEDNVTYVEHAISALKVFEHINNPVTAEVINV